MFFCTRREPFPRPRVGILRAQEKACRLSLRDPKRISRCRAHASAPLVCQVCLQRLARPCCWMQKASHCSREEALQKAPWCSAWSSTESSMPHIWTMRNVQESCDYLFAVGGRQYGLAEGRPTDVAFSPSARGSTGSQKNGRFFAVDASPYGGSQKADFSPLAQPGGRYLCRCPWRN